jgi:oligopeptide transport system substrate-binding protein
MNRKSYPILMLVVVLLCALGVICTGAGYLAYKWIGPELRPPQGTEMPTIVALTPAAQRGGVLRLAGGRPPTLDPAMVQDSTSAEYIVHLFSGLVALDSDLEVRGDLARSWTLSADGLRYRFELLPNATFQDGTPITAHDFKYSLERACSPGLGSPVAESYLGDIVGVPEYAVGKAAAISGIRVVSEQVLEIQIDAPKAYFLAKLTYPTACVVDRRQIERQGADWQRKPNGSGPFVLDSISQERIVLVRNARYHGKPPALDRVEFLLGSGLPMTMYENDQLDIVDVGASEIERMLDPVNPLHAELHSASELSVQYLAFNLRVPPFDDPAVRQAFAHAIDKQKLADLVYKGTATPARGILPPAMPDYDESLVGLEYDPNRARELLAASRYGSPGAMPPIVLAISGESGHMPSDTRAIVSMIQENLGLEMTVEQVAWGDFLLDMNDQVYQCFTSGWIADYPDSQNFVDLLFYSASSQNHMAYRNGEVDALLEKARIESNADERTRLYRRAEQIIIAEAPWVPLTHGRVYTLVKPYVQGFRASSAMYPWLVDIALIG